MASANGGSYDMVVQLRRELNVLLDKEGRMWAQRPRAQWLANGDRNTKFSMGWPHIGSTRILLRASRMCKVNGSRMRRWLVLFLWTFILGCLPSHVQPILREY